MTENTNTQNQDFEAWLTAKPYWEQYIWKLNLEKDSLVEEDIDRCYQYLSEYLGFIMPLKEEKQKICFKNEIAVEPDAGETPKIKLVEVREFANVNALSRDCSIKIGPNLTLVYGGNGTGKSGVSRLLCNACFSRGERDILPNVKLASAASSENAKASFVLNVGSPTPVIINYSLGDNYNELKRFSVFDTHSVLIHLDQPNNIKFTPGQVKIFDKVADTIIKIEEKLLNEKKEHKKDNPFDLIFPREGTTDSSVTQFCRAINASTKVEDFLKYADFNPIVDEAKITELQKRLENKIKLDVPKRKMELRSEIQNLRVFKSSIEEVISCFAIERTNEINKLIKDIVEKKRLSQSLGAQSFNDGIFNATGSFEWKTLINAAKDLYEAEFLLQSDNDMTHCLLCHQKLSEEAKSLFLRYWKFLNSKVESELAQLSQKQKHLLHDLKAVQATYPKFRETDAGVRVLEEHDGEYFSKLQAKVAVLSQSIADWISTIEKQECVNRASIPEINLKAIDVLVESKTKEESDLIDPSDEIKEISNQLIVLRHKKKVKAAKDKGLDYLNDLKWLSKASYAGLAGIKMAITRRRTDFFNIGVAKDYKAVLNNELEKMGCEFDLVMHTSGEKGNTVKEYRINFAEDYNPSQILSEGEQNVCSIADFLAEVQLDNNNSGIVFDDPVTSLDHERKDKIAERMVLQAARRQVVVLTHDVVFMSQLVKHSCNHKINYVTHWMRKVDGVPGCVDDNTSPRLSCLASLKADLQEAMKNYTSLGPKEQEWRLAAAFDALRSSCEALIEEILFAGTIHRYDDHIKVQNLEDAVFNPDLALGIAELHGKISELAFMHNRSGEQRQSLPSLVDFEKVKVEFEALEKRLKEAKKNSKNERANRKKLKLASKQGW